ncbi:nucleotidyltransferase domain-containing protein [Candidatus Woesearchaeota archaeon]|nr:nucleotidyltransferase domain-containing protein [Candidatus Woesearchaeota archaeon]
MKKISDLLKKVSDQLRPTITKIPEVADFITKINASIKKNRIKAITIPGGSYAKQTFLKEDHDIDIFIAFDLQYKDQDISSLLRTILKPFNAVLIHGSRDYYQIRGKYYFEIIPVLAIKKPSDAKNVTDFSLKHVAWVNTNGKKLKDDIRLAKKFCKTARIYGAESYISGFSGHVLDILVIFYGGFLPLLKASLSWKPQKVIDYNNRHKGRALFHLNKSKTQSGLIVIDPVQPDRNAAAALSTENMMKFQETAKSFLKRPSKEFFEEKKIDMKELRRKGAVVVTGQTLEGKRDVVGAKAVKVFEHIKKTIDGEFGIKDAGWIWDGEFIMWFIPKKKMLSEYQEHAGPPVDKEKFAEMFRKKYKNAMLKKGRWVAQVKRRHTEILPFTREIVMPPYVKERLKKIRIRHA